MPQSREEEKNIAFSMYELNGPAPWVMKFQSLVLDLFVNRNRILTF